MTPRRQSPQAVLVDASRHGCLDLIRDAVENGAHVDFRCAPNHSTALHAASFHGHFCIVRYLVGQKADLKGINDHGRTPADRASDGGHPGVFKHLLLSTPSMTLFQLLSVHMAWLSTLALFCARHAKLVFFRLWLRYCRTECACQLRMLIFCRPRPFGRLFSRAFRHNSLARNAWILRDVCLNGYKPFVPHAALETFEAWQRDVIFKTILRVEVSSESINSMDLRSTVIVTNHPPSPALEHMLFQWIFPHLSVYGVVRKDYYDFHECIFQSCRWVPIHSPFLHGQETARGATRRVDSVETVGNFLAKGNTVWISAERGWTTHPSPAYQLATGAFRIASNAANEVRAPIKLLPFFIAFTGNMKRRLVHVMELKALAVPPHASRADISKAREVLNHLFLQLHAEHQLSCL